MNSNSPLCLLFGVILSPFTTGSAVDLQPAPVLIRSASGRLEAIATPVDAWQARSDLRELNRLLARAINAIPNPGDAFAAFDTADLEAEREHFDRTARRVCAIPGVGDTLKREVRMTREVIERLSDTTSS